MYIISTGSVAELLIPRNLTKFHFNARRYLFGSNTLPLIETFSNIKFNA